MVFREPPGPLALRSIQCTTGQKSSEVARPGDYEKGAKGDARLPTAERVPMTNSIYAAYKKDQKLSS